MAHVLHEDKHEGGLWAQASIVGGPSLEEATGALALEDVGRAGNRVGILAAVAVHVRLHYVHWGSDRGSSQACADILIQERHLATF